MTEMRNNFDNGLLANYEVYGRDVQKHGFCQRRHHQAWGISRMQFTAYMQAQASAICSFELIIRYSPSEEVEYYYVYLLKPNLSFNKSTLVLLSDVKS